MAYENFIPSIWNETINRELEKSLVFAENTNRKYEGDVSKMGDSVHILGVGKPTIRRANDKDITLEDAENVSETSIVMNINQIAYFNYKVDDIDRRQAVGGVMEALSKETSQGLADEMDIHIAQLATANEAIKIDKTPAKIDTSNILKYIDSGLQKLYEQNVKTSTKITITVPPRFYFLLKQAYTEIDTDNTKMLENGKVGRYGNIEVKMSNNVATESSGAVDLIQLKTDNAIAFVNPMTHTEAYRPEKKFSDAVKGFILFDVKIVRPKEMIILNPKYV